LEGLFWRIYQSASERRILAIAAGVTFYALSAIFPGIIPLVALYGLLTDPSTSTIGKHLTDLSSVPPAGAMDGIGDQLQRLSRQGHANG
jgi:membrane protein